MFEIESIRVLMQPFVQAFSTVIISGVATSLVVQAMKSQAFPLPVSRFPRATSAVLSFIASMVAIYVSDINLIFGSLFDYLAFGIGVFITAAITYNQVLKGTVKNDGKSTEVLDA